MNKLMLIVIAVAFAASFSGCKAVQASLIVGPDINLTASDTDVVFSCRNNGKTGLYTMSIASGLVTEIIKPRPGWIFNPKVSSDGQSVEYLFTENRNKKGYYYFATTSLNGDSVNKIFQFEKSITNLTVASDSLIYFASAQHFGRSSPISQPRAKMMELYKISRTGQDVQLISNFGAYTMAGDLHLDKSGSNMYLNIMFDKSELPNGPYKYNLASGGLSYLAPKNMDAMHPLINFKADINRFFYISQLRPIPSRDSSVVILTGSYTIYAVDVTTKVGKLLHEQKQNSRYRFSNMITNVEPFHSSNDLLFYQEDTSFGSFVILREDGEKNMLPIDMSAFEEHFQE